MVRAMLGISLRDRVRNEEIGKLTRVEDVAFQKQSGNALGLWPETMKRKEQASWYYGSQEHRSGALGGWYWGNIRTPVAKKAPGSSVGEDCRPSSRSRRKKVEKEDWAFLKQNLRGFRGPTRTNLLNYDCILNLGLENMVQVESEFKPSKWGRKRWRRNDTIERLRSRCT